MYRADRANRHIARAAELISSLRFGGNYKCPKCNVSTTNYLIIDTRRKILFIM